MILLEQEGPLWRVIIDRPDKANSLTGEMLADLGQIARDAQGKAQVLVLTGAGKVFSAGADLDEARAGLATSPLWEELSGALAEFQGFSIAALNGTLAGGAFGMALACDLRIAVEEAKFFYPVMKLGFLPQPSDPGRLVALVGPARAKLILMAGQKLTAAEAMSIGLVDRVVDRAEFATNIKELVADASQASMKHVNGIKMMI